MISHFDAQNALRVSQGFNAGQVGNTFEHISWLYTRSIICDIQKAKIWIVPQKDSDKHQPNRRRLCFGM